MSIKPVVFMPVDPSGKALTAVIGATAENLKFYTEVGFEIQGLYLAKDVDRLLLAAKTGLKCLMTNKPNDPDTAWIRKVLMSDGEEMEGTCSLASSDS